jgi:hypothetical protein
LNFPYLFCEADICLQGVDINLNKPPLFILIAIALLLLQSACACRVLLDLAGGLLVVLLIFPSSWVVLDGRAGRCCSHGRNPALHAVLLVLAPIFSAVFVELLIAHSLELKRPLVFPSLRVT